ncbi:phage portal protein, partial [Bacillus thuringiensis]|nr:phage portal protein [Bacillus thuringiensis]
VLDNSQEYETFTVNTDLLKLIQSNTFSTKQIAKVFGIPLNRFGMELVNSQDGIQNSLYLASTLSGYARMIVDELNAKLGLNCEMNFENLLNDTLDERRKRLFAGEASGIEVLEVNEIREYYGYEALDDPAPRNVSRETIVKDDEHGQ